jgi:hypothetical protein
MQTTLKKEELNLPEGEWNILVNKDSAGVNVLGNIKNKVIVKPLTGMVLKKK